MGLHGLWGRRALPVIVLYCCMGCGFWRTLPASPDANTISRGDTLQLHKGSSARTVRVIKIEPPWLEGVEDAPKGPAPVRLDLRDFDEVERYTFGRGVTLTTALVIGIAAAIGAASAFAAIPKGD